MKPGRFAELEAGAARRGGGRVHEFRASARRGARSRPPPRWAARRRTPRRRAAADARNRRAAHRGCRAGRRRAEAFRRRSARRGAAQSAPSSPSSSESDRGQPRQIRLDDLGEAHVRRRAVDGGGSKRVRAHALRAGPRAHPAGVAAVAGGSSRCSERSRSLRAPEQPAEPTRAVDASRRRRRAVDLDDDRVAGRAAAAPAEAPARESEASIRRGAEARRRATARRAVAARRSAQRVIGLRCAASVSPDTARRPRPHARTAESNRARTARAVAEAVRGRPRRRP